MSTILFILTYVILPISVILNILFIWSAIRRIKKEDSQLNRVNQKHKNNLRAQEKTINNLKNKIKNLNEENSKLKSSKTSHDSFVQEISRPKVTNKITENDPSHSAEEKPTTVEFVVPKENILYLPSPFEDAKFSVEDAKLDKTPTSLYQINLSPSNDFGELTIIEGADLTRALNSPDRYLETACIYENPFNPKASNIVVMESGKAKLEGRDWMVISKIKIKFVK